MAKWAYVNSDFQVEEVHFDLPKNWRNVSNLSYFENAPDILAKLGWYPVINNTQPIDNLTETYAPVEHVFEPNENIVIENAPVVALENPITSAQIFAAQRQDFLAQLLQTVQRKLQESDWTQLPDVLEDKGNDWVTPWKDYRRQLRSLLDIYALTDNQDVVDFDAVIWPVEPTSPNL